VPVQSFVALVGDLQKWATTVGVAASLKGL
jgi:hypothetical protein